MTEHGKLTKLAFEIFSSIVSCGYGRGGSYVDEGAEGEEREREGEDGRAAFEFWTGVSSSRYNSMRPSDT